MATAPSLPLTGNYQLRRETAVITAWLAAFSSTGAQPWGAAPALPRLPRARLRSPRLLLWWGLGGPVGLHGCGVQVASARSGTEWALGSGVMSSRSSCAGPAHAALPAQPCRYLGNAPITGSSSRLLPAPRLQIGHTPRTSNFLGRWSRLSLASRQAGDAMLPCSAVPSLESPSALPVPGVGEAQHPEVLPVPTSGAEPPAPRLRAQLRLPAA